MTTFDDLYLDAFLTGGTATAATEPREEPALTVETLLAAYYALLPKVQYQVSSFMPALDKDGEPAIWAIQQPHAADVFGARDDVQVLVLLHPDNLLSFIEQCQDRCQLIPIRASE